MARRSYRLKEAQDAEMYTDHTNLCVVCGSETEDFTSTIEHNSELVSECPSCGTRVEWESEDEIVELHTEQEHLDELEDEYPQYTLDGVRY